MWFRRNRWGVPLPAHRVFTLGLSTLRNGHPWMFFFEFFFPLLWIFGAFMRPSSESTHDLRQLDELNQERRREP